MAGRDVLVDKGLRIGCCCQYARGECYARPLGRTAESGARLARFRGWGLQIPPVLDPPAAPQRRSARSIGAVRGAPHGAAAAGLVGVANSTPPRRTSNELGRFMRPAAQTDDRPTAALWPAARLASGREVAVHPCRHLQGPLHAGRTPVCGASREPNAGGARSHLTRTNHGYHRSQPLERPSAPSAGARGSAARSRPGFLGIRRGRSGRDSGSDGPGVRSWHPGRGHRDRLGRNLGRPSRYRGQAAGSPSGGNVRTGQFGHRRPERRAGGDQPG